MNVKVMSALLSALVLCGCGTGYCWRSTVPEPMRTVAVPTFRNESNVAELGPLASRQILREFQREGTFKIRTTGHAALEVQGVIKSASAEGGFYDRRSGSRSSAYTCVAVAEVTVIDKRTHRILIDNATFRATANYSVGQDRTTALRDASGRLMDDLSRQVVDAVLNLKWE